MKFSFKKSALSKPKPINKFKPESSETPELVTLSSKNRVIPPKQNQWPLEFGGKTLQFEVESARPEPVSEISYGLNVRQQGKGNPNSIMIKKLKIDLDRLPDDDETFDSYNEVPVESFAEALMAGYGWKKGMAIGRNAKEDTKVVEYKRRSAKEGLGFSLDSGVPPKASGDGAAGGANELKIRDSKEDSRENGKKVEEKSSSSGNGGVSWLRSHIRVRIISKSFKGGRFYLKKGEVVDVVGPTTCDISIDDGREIVQGVEQDILETAVPKRGGRVLVLIGKHKGVYGCLVEKDTEREAGVVQDADSRELFKVRFEQIAEYVGDPSYIGY